jgi:hypothetical protein
MSLLFSSEGGARSREEYIACFIQVIACFIQVIACFIQVVCFGVSKGERLVYVVIFMP